LASSTLEQYRSAYRKWITFCAENHLTEIPAQPNFVACCIARVAAETGSISAADKLAAAIAFEHRSRFLPSPTSHESFKLLMSSIRRRHSSERKPAEPLTLAMLRRMIDHLFSSAHGRDGQLADIATWRTVWRVVIEFYTLGRWSDVSRLRRSNIHFYSSPRPHMTVLFIGGKNDQVITITAYPVLFTDFL
jgi:hypothetical protein